MRFIFIPILVVASVAYCAQQKEKQTSQQGQQAITEVKTQEASVGAMGDSMQMKMDETKMAADTSKAPKAKVAPKTEKSTAMSPDKGIGPIQNVTLGPIDPKMADQGSSLFSSICTACHSLDKKMVGPPLRNVTERRTPEYIMNMLVNTQEMQNKDPEVKKLVAEYKVLMAIPKLTQDQARSLLEYLRQADQ